MSDWTDELKEQVVEMYQEAEPTPENSMEIVKGIAEEVEKTPNGVRMILTKAGVYVKKTPTAKGSGDGETKSTRVNKADAIAGLKTALEANSVDVDEAIVDKLTGKAAVYFTSVVNKLVEEE